MRMNGAIRFGAVAAFLAATPAHSFIDLENDGLNSPLFGLFDIETGLDAALTVATRESNNSVLLAEIDAQLKAEAITDDGIRWGAGFRLRAQRDAPRDGFATRAGSTGNVTPPGVRPRSLATGRYRDSTPSTREESLDLEEAFIFLRPGWGEVRVGMTPGAARFEPPVLPTTASFVRIDGGPLDPTGVAATRLDNAASGNGPKFFVASERVFGLRASASYTPQSSGCGVDICVHERDVVRGLASAELDDVFELAASFDHDFGEAGRWELAVTWATGDPVAFVYTQDYEAWGATARWTQGPVSIGLSRLSANNALSGGRYTATAIAARFDRNDWSFGLEASQSRDGFLNEDAQATQFSISRLIGDHFAITGGLSRAENENSAGLTRVSDSRLTGFLELSVRY